MNKAKLVTTGVRDGTNWNRAGSQALCDDSGGVVQMDFYARAALHGTRVSLLPLAPSHSSGLERVAAEKDIWRWMPADHSTPGSMDRFIESALTLRDKCLAVPFATIDRITGQLAGSTRFHNIEPEHRRLEIGFTWIGTGFQRSHINTEAKLLQLWYAFEILRCRRVEWKADAENLKSRRAILRLGATEEGLFRKHMLYPDGRNRDSVYFSMIDDEWFDKKSDLEARLGYGFAPSYATEEDEAGSC
jgi:RimJ/RimL family protein N-acetyltransferase